MIAVNVDVGMPPATGLRQKKKLETRLHLKKVALRLFAERGFDEVTVADIAVEANVSEKTVFNYFASKEDLVVAGREEIEAELIRAISERKPGESILTAVRRHTRAVAERLSALPPGHRANFRKIVQNSAAIRDRLHQMSGNYEQQLADLLAAETGAPVGDPTAQVVARVLGGLVRLAFCGMTGWSDGRKVSLEETLERIDAAFGLIGKGLSGYGVRPKR